MMAKEITLQIGFRGIFPEVAVYVRGDFVGYAGDKNTVANVANRLGIDPGDVEAFLTDEAEFLMEDYHRTIFHKRLIPRSRWLEKQLTEELFTT
ncbi:hypothetical protein MHLNE_08980 [Moorella humiferrea]|uniref:hypothetical protein n=1 Tax=Neomoorella humiferrea TaxID=676965 RepID=UPI0030D0C427